MAESNRKDKEDTERSLYGAPASGLVLKDRFKTDEIFQRIIVAADKQIETSFRQLLFSALAGGFAITVTFLMYASLTSSTDGDPVLSAILYPIGFVYIILGGYQLYTENTLPPVLLFLERLASLPALLSVWLIVLLGNFIGGGLGALVLSSTGVFSPDVANTAVEISKKGIETPFWSLFFKASFAGFIVAGVVWLDYASRDTISRFFLVYIAFLSIPLGNLYHVVVSFTESMYLMFNGKAPILLSLKNFVFPVLLGNTIGGVFLVTIVNYFQTTEKRVKKAREEGTERQLTIREWLLGGIVGRPYVPTKPIDSKKQDKKQ